jgi:MarR family transcriptional regulator, negative regulator of the multidrug operon emrRAB
VSPGREEDERLANLLGALALTLARRIERAVTADTGLGPSSAAALVTLHTYAEDEPLGVLGGALGLSHPATVRLVDRLETGGLVVRGRGRGDARTVGLRLTVAGRHAARRTLGARASALREALAGLDAAERRALAPLLERLLAHATVDGRAANLICRLCDAGACGHPARCPVTQAVA